ncbi:hypothetical protein [Actinomyces vulturis]|uniref:hypothetical protein n=1 Tax=Actinomyces vulturis TaxID=1857645 RepID=UPI00159EBD0F|nr:hypothetical protein [Actinomyces vulturis]
MKRRIMTVGIVLAAIVAVAVALIWHNIWLYVPSVLVLTFFVLRLIFCRSITTPSVSDR